jgi:hypothetical protein
MTSDLRAVPTAELLPFEKERFRSEYERYFKGKRQNFFRALTEFGGLWDALQLLNDIWMREFSHTETLLDKGHLLPKTVFMAAHARFLTAIELAFSCCVGDAYSILRDGIEATTHAHKMFKEPAAATAWTDKHKGTAQLAAYKKIFEEKKKENLFPEEHGLRRLHFYYANLSELATHTSVTSIGKHFKEVLTPGNVRWEFNYFETNSQRLAAFLSVLLPVSSHMEDAFFGCFGTRLNLDSELVRMRSQFQLVRKQQMKYPKDIYKLDSIK